MAHTDRKAPLNPMSREKPWARQYTRSQARALAKALMETGKHDQAGSRTMKGTGGWVSW